MLRIQALLNMGQVNKISLEVKDVLDKVEIFRNNILSKIEKLWDTLKKYLKSFILFNLKNIKLVSNFILLTAKIYNFYRLKYDVAGPILERFKNIEICNK